MAKKPDLTESNKPDQPADSISTTLFLPHHEKISLISSLGPSADLHPPQHLPNCGDRQAQCRICLLCTQSKRKPLISPCRCSGTMQFVHSTCLLRWLDVSARKASAAPRCELCGYKYKRAGLINLDPTQMRVPSVGLRDKILNFLTLLLICIMVFCGWVMFRYIRLAVRRWKAHRVGKFLNDDDVTMASACILFAIALSLVVFTQHRAETPLYSLLTRCWARNRAFKEYDLESDAERKPRSTDVV